MRSSRLPALACALLAGALPAGAPAAGAGPGPAVDSAVTTRDPAVPLDVLDLMVTPLTRQELEVEAQAWLGLVRDKVRQIADAEIAVRLTKEQVDQAEESAGAAPAADATAEGRSAILTDLAALRGERTALFDRAGTVLAELQEKGGDVTDHRRYLAAVSGLRLDVTDTGAAWATLSGWLTSEQGGVRWGLNLVKFAVILAAFWVLSAVLGQAADRALRRVKRLTALLREFISTTVRRVALAVGIIVGLAALEVNIGPLLAIIGAAGFVVAFALQSTLSNFASGIMILLYRPFDVGDAVDVAGISGTVASLNLVSTTLTTADNKRVVVPNNAIWGGIITNSTGSETRRVDMEFGIGYDSDMDRAREVLERIVKEHRLVLEQPEPLVRVHKLADSSVNLVCRPWVKTADYWTVYWDVTQKVKEEFDRSGIKIPFPQSDVHVHYSGEPAEAGRPVAARAAAR